MAPRILIIGKNGQLAHSLGRTSLPGSPVWLARPDIDLSDAGSIARAVGEQNPDIIINAAAYTAVDKAEDHADAARAINTQGSAALAAAARIAGAKLIHVSTDYVFDGTSDQAYVETDPTAPLGVYGHTKRDGELAIINSGCDYTIVRTAWVYSPFGNNFLKTMLRLADGRDELNVVADQVGNPTSALDLADAIAAMIGVWADDPSRGLNQIYHVAGTGDASWADFASYIFQTSGELGGPMAKVNPIPATQYPTPAKRPANSRLDGGKFADMFGFSMPHWHGSTRVVVAELLNNAQR